MSIAARFDAHDFEPVVAARSSERIARPSQSYWQDAWRRLKSNRRALISLILLIALALFTIAGPWLWPLDPSAQDVDRVSEAPGSAAAAEIVAQYQAWDGVTIGPGATPAPGLSLASRPITEAVQLLWDPVPDVSGYRIYRSLYDPTPDRALGLPLADTFSPLSVSYEDRLDLEPIRYWYSVVGVERDGTETEAYQGLVVEPRRVVSIADALSRGWIDSGAGLSIGDRITLPFHPFGTDYLGRDMLARLMHGARVSLFIGVIAPFVFVFAGVLYGSVAGFVGGRVDQVLMRFADFVVALPFLLFMILFKIAFGIGPGESGIFPMLVALVLLMWPSTARLVRGQILQIRQEGYVAASQLLGARTGYLIFRHMIPNTMGVILVTLTFAVPSAIFIEAFLSFIGMGVAPPTPSWGSMSNEGVRTMLSHPHELVFPAIFISVTVLAFNLLGDGLRDALDVRMRGTE
jgi:oligopeptide transport system permease protein